MVTLVTVDVRERRSNVPALLEELGATVEMRRLDAGDYVCGPQTVVERKTVRDLHLTIIGGVCGGSSVRFETRLVGPA